MEKERFVPIGSLSDMVILGIPVLGMNLFQKRTAVSIALSSLKHRMNICVLEYLSTTTRQALKTAAQPGDREVTKSMLLISHGLDGSWIFMIRQQLLPVALLAF